MNESLMFGALSGFCSHLLAIRKSGAWSETHSTFEEWAVDRLSISKTRLRLFCSFAKFCAMCRAERVREPESPDHVAPLLKLKQSLWLDTWRLVLDHPARWVNAKHVEAVMERFGIVANKRVPPEVLERMRLKRATKTIAELGDGEQLAERLGGKVGRHFEPALTTLIDADQRRRDIGDGTA